VTRDGHHYQDQERGVVGTLSDPGRRPCRALSGGSPDGRAAGARSAGPHPQVCGTRRYAAHMAAPAMTGPGPSSVPGILSPRKIIGTYRKDGGEMRQGRRCPFRVNLTHWPAHLSSGPGYGGRKTYPEGKFRGIFKAPSELLQALWLRRGREGS
jgi:hypothetical protein